jgi:hypothetical protein
MANRSRTELGRVCEHAVEYLDTPDIAAIIDRLFDKVIATLRKDARMPLLSRDSWELALADTRNAAELETRRG